MSNVLLKFWYNCIIDKVTIGFNLTWKNRDELNSSEDFGLLVWLSWGLGRVFINLDLTWFLQTTRAIGLVFDFFRFSLSMAPKACYPIRVMSSNIIEERKEKAWSKYYSLCMRGWHASKEDPGLLRIHILLYPFQHTFHCHPESILRRFFHDVFHFIIKRTSPVKKRISHELFGR